MKKAKTKEVSKVEEVPTSYDLNEWYEDMGEEYSELDDSDLELIRLYLDKVLNAISVDLSAKDVQVIAGVLTEAVTDLKKSYGSNEEFL